MVVFSPSSSYTCKKPVGAEMRVEHTKDATQQNIEMKGST